MSEQHTPGKLKVGDSGSIAFDENGMAVFEECPHGGIGKIQGQKNILRAVACWNACEGISTNALELMTGDLSIKNQIVAIESRKPAGRRTAYRKQRDELLEALKKAEAALSDIGDAEREPGDDVAWCEARAAQSLPFIRAAITKVEGGEA